eukprot:2755533-Prymnesium_polylepis.1
MPSASRRKMAASSGPSARCESARVMPSCCRYSAAIPLCALRAIATALAVRVAGASWTTAASTSMRLCAAELWSSALHSACPRAVSVASSTAASSAAMATSALRLASATATSAAIISPWRDATLVSSASGIQRRASPPHLEARTACRSCRRGARGGSASSMESPRRFNHRRSSAGLTWAASPRACTQPSRCWA